MTASSQERERREDWEDRKIRVAAYVANLAEDKKQIDDELATLATLDYNATTQGYIDKRKQQEAEEFAVMGYLAGNMGSVYRMDAASGGGY